MAGSPSSRRAKTYSPSSLRTRSLSPALTLSSSSLRAVKAYKAMKRDDLGMKEMEFGSECSETESEPRYAREQLSCTERGRSLFQKDVRKVKRFRTNCSIPGGCGGCGVYATALLEAGGRADPRLLPPAGQLMPPPSRVPRARLGARRPFPANFLFLKVKLVGLVRRVCRRDESAGGSPTLSEPTGTSGSWAQLELGSPLPPSKKGNGFFFFLIIILRRAPLLVARAPVNTARASSHSSCDKRLTPAHSLTLARVGGYFSFHGKIIASTNV